MSDARKAEDDAVAARITAMMKVAAPLAVVLLAIGVGVVRGAPLAILVLAAGALAAVIALFWQSVRTLVGETPLSGADAYAIAAPRAEEEKKRAVLRALKDLEFEKSVGKISTADYDKLVLQYRAEARTLLQQIDDSARPRRERVLALVDAKLREAGLGGGLGEARDRGAPTPAAPAEPPSIGAAPDAPADDATRAAADREDEESEEAAEAERPVCGACGTHNDADAAFCKKCGAKMSAIEDAADAT